MGATISLGRAGIVLLVIAAATTSGCRVAQGCPAALLSGVLVERDGALVVQAPSGDVTAVDWSKYWVRREDGKLIVAEWFNVLAREGDTVNLGGGVAGEGDGPFKVCGQVEAVAAG
ncbi:MAG TPA: hypothetical protein VK867_11280 [Candidatus Limnocylindrales bacterium]|nr:hypothetical protein [Candidatus Limnocylindrales bacterium]